jgi:signal transduction histidine kinase
MDVSWVMQQLPPSDAALVEKARAMNAMLDRIVAETRRIAADLRPLMLDDLGFAAAAEWLTGDFSRRSGIRCELDLDQAASEIAEPQATALFRMLQESLTNVARHSGATWVRVRLQRDEGRLTLSVQDNGRGFQPGDEAKRGSFGLRGLRERAALLEGQVRVEPAPEGGTLLEVRMPCVESATVQVAA